jgi:hypothetical protein
MGQQAVWTLSWKEENPFHHRELTLNYRNVPTLSLAILTQVLLQPHYYLSKPYQYLFDISAPSGNKAIANQRIVSNLTDQAIPAHISLDILENKNKHLQWRQVIPGQSPKYLSIQSNILRFMCLFEWTCLWHTEPLHPHVMVQQLLCRSSHVRTNFRLTGKDSRSITIINVEPLVSQA